MSGFMPDCLFGTEVVAAGRNAGRRGVIPSFAGGWPRPGSRPERARAGEDEVLLLVARPQGGLLDLHEELDVGAGLPQLVEQQVEGLLRLERAEHPAQL